MSDELTEVLSPIVHSIYAAGEQTIPWSMPLEEIADAVDARDTGLIFVDWSVSEPLVHEIVRATPQTVRAYNEKWNKHDAWVNSGHPLMQTEDVVFASQEIMSDEELMRTPFYEGFLKPAGLSQMMAISVIARDNLIAAVVCNYPPEAGPRTERQLRIGRALLPHLRHALTLHRRFSALRSFASASLAVLGRA